MNCLAACVLLGIVGGMSLLMAFVFQLLWNWIMPALFGLPVIDYWMAFGIMFLLSIVGSMFRSK